MDDVSPPVNDGFFLKAPICAIGGICGFLFFGRDFTGAVIVLCPFLKDCMTAFLAHTQESFGFKNPANLLARENPKFRHALPRSG
jgi:hypothetical protein